MFLVKGNFEIKYFKLVVLWKFRFFIMQRGYECCDFCYNEKLQSLKKKRFIYRRSVYKISLLELVFNCFRWIMEVK